MLKPLLKRLRPAVELYCFLPEEYEGQTDDRGHPLTSLYPEQMYVLKQGWRVLEVSHRLSPRMREMGYSDEPAEIDVHA